LITKIRKWKLRYIIPISTPPSSFEYENSKFESSETWEKDTAQLPVAARVTGHYMTGTQVCLPICSDLSPTPTCTRRLYQRPQNVPQTPPSPPPPRHQNELSHDKLTAAALKRILKYTTTSCGVSGLLYSSRLLLLLPSLLLPRIFPIHFLPYTVLTLFLHSHHFLFPPTSFLVFYPENGGSTFCRNISTLLPE
jgi:hypothetical protein